MCFFKDLYSVLYSFHLFKRNQVELWVLLNFLKGSDVTQTGWRSRKFNPNQDISGRRLPTETQVKFGMNQLSMFLRLTYTNNLSCQKIYYVGINIRSQCCSKIMCYCNKLVNTSKGYILNAIKLQKFNIGLLLLPRNIVFYNTFPQWL